MRNADYVPSAHRINSNYYPSFNAATTDAYESVSSAAHLAASHAAALRDKGRQYLQAGEYPEAMACFNQLLQTGQPDVDTVASLAQCLFYMGQMPLALKTYELALRLSPRSTHILNAMAFCYRAMGEFDQAIACYKKVLKTEPDKEESLYYLALLEKHHPQSSFVKNLLRLHARTAVDVNARTAICFALAHVYESAGDHKQAFAYYDEGNRLQSSACPYDEEKYFALMDDIEACFTPERFASLKQLGSPDVTPIFIIGMPRSGTTLVEQILASHPECYGVGEPDIMSSTANALRHLTKGHYPHGLDALTQQDIAAAAAHFLARLRSFCPQPAGHIVIKTLNNHFYIGLIRLLFPNASIIHCERDPMDTCWSVFRQFFGGPHPYGNDQTSLGRYFRRYQKLMDHWRRVLPGAFLDIGYEQLVASPEAEIRRILAYCGLPWDERCLHFHRTKRPVMTASLQQVRKPLYTSSLRSWEPVADELAPLRQALGL